MPSSMTLTVSWWSSCSSSDHDVPGAVAVAEGVLHRVLEQLGQHDRERRRHRRRAACRRRPRTRKRTGRSGDWRLVLGHARPGAGRSRRRRRRRRPRATASRGRGRSCGCAAPTRRCASLASSDDGAPALQPQQRRDRLQVVLHPVVDLPDGGVLRQQQAVPLAQLAERRARSSTPPVTVPPARIGMQRVSRVISLGLVDLLDDGLVALEGVPARTRRRSPARPGAARRRWR